MKFTLCFHVQSCSGSILPTLYNIALKTKPSGIHSSSGFRIKKIFALLRQELNTLIFCGDQCLEAGTHSHLVWQVGTLVFIVVYFLIHFLGSKSRSIHFVKKVFFYLFVRCIGNEGCAFSSVPIEFPHFITARKLHLYLLRNTEALALCVFAVYKC